MVARQQRPGGQEVLLHLGLLGKAAEAGQAAAGGCAHVGRLLPAGSCGVEDVGGAGGCGVHVGGGLCGGTQTGGALVPCSYVVGSKMLSGVHIDSCRHVDISCLAVRLCRAGTQAAGMC